ncbi:trihelix transcription factor GTL1-like [Triticum urartu]|nr:trihelix transcription factor GTL1-like [Triticum urartu]
MAGPCIVASWGSVIGLFVGYVCVAQLSANGFSLSGILLLSLSLSLSLPLPSSPRTHLFSPPPPVHPSPIHLPPVPSQRRRLLSGPGAAEKPPTTEASSFPADDMLGDSGGNGGAGPWPVRNQWPREETLALIRIRSEMAAAFRDAAVRGKVPLWIWEEVSGKLAELGYERRSAKKCREKLGGMHRSYKRAEQSRAGRQDGRTYRFSEALDALHAATARAWLQKHQEQLLMVLGGRGPPQPHAAFSAPRPMSAMPPPPPPPPRFPIMPAPVSWAAPAAAVELPQPPPVCLQGLSVPSMSESGSDDDDGPEDGEMAAATGDGPGGLGKRKRGGVRKKMMAFVEGLMKQVVERQEEMQQRFLAAMEKREAERAAREEAWRRQEVARLKREQEQRAHERAAAAARHASVIAFIQRVGGQAAQVPPVVFPTPTPTPTPTPMQFQTSLPSQATPEPIAAAPLQRQPPPQPRQKLPPRRATPPPPQQQQAIPAAPLQWQPPPQRATPPQPIPAAPLQWQPPPQPPQAQHKEMTREEAHCPRLQPAHHHSPWFPPPWSSASPKFADHSLQQS